MDNNRTKDTLKMLEDISDQQKSDDTTGNVPMDIANNDAHEILSLAMPIVNLGYHEDNQYTTLEGEENKEPQFQPVSPYYSEMYKRRFGQYPSINRTPLKVTCAVADYFQQESTYPIELFGKCVESINDYYPVEGELVDFRTNPAMNKGTAVFSSGYWRKGICIKVEKSENRGFLYYIQDDMTNYVFHLNRHQIRKTIL